MPSLIALGEQVVSWTGENLSRASAYVWTQLSSQTQKTQTPHGGKRWQLTALPPKASPPPSPLLPSEIKYSASLVRGQAVVHGVLGMVLFTFGVLGSHRWGTNTCVPGLVCGVAGVATGVCGGLAHRIWYKNWAIKSFLVSSAAVVVLSLLALALTFYFTLSSSSAYDAHAQYESFRLERLHRQDGEQEQDEIIGTFFELPTPPPSKSLVGNMVVGLLLQLLVSIWSVLTAWKGVRAHEFTPRRREELLKQIMAAAPARKGQVDAEDVSSMPLAALYQLLQTHPELLQGAAPQQPQRPASRHSMDYRERVCRYLSKAHEADPVSTQGNGSPTPCHSSALRSQKPPPPGAAPETKMAATQNEESIKSQPRERLASPTLSAKCQSHKTSLSTSSSSSSPKLRASSDRTLPPTREGNEEPAVQILPPHKPSEVENSLDLKKSSDVDNSSCSKASSNGEKSCEINETSDSGKSSESNESTNAEKSADVKETTVAKKSGADKILNNIQPQSLVLGSKTLPPLSTHLIKPSDLAPKRATQQMRRFSMGAKLSSSLQRDPEYNVTFRSTLDRPPPVPRKEYQKPKFVLNADVHRMLRKSEMQINGRPRQARSISDLGDVNRNLNVNELTCKDLPCKGLNEVKTHHTDSSTEDKSLKSKVSSQRETGNLSNSTRSRSASNPPRILKKKDRKPPPIPTAKETLVQGPLSTNEESEEKFTGETNASKNRDTKHNEISTTFDAGSVSVGQKGHLEDDDLSTDVGSDGKLPFSESPSLQMVHGGEGVTPRSVPSSDSGVSSVLGSDDNISSDDASPPESHVGIVEESSADKQASDPEKSLSRDEEVSKNEVAPSQKSDRPVQSCPLKDDNINEDGKSEKKIPIENVSHFEKSVPSHEESELETCVGDNEVDSPVSLSGTTCEIENNEKCLADSNDSSSATIDRETFSNAGEVHSSAKFSHASPILPEKDQGGKISSDGVNDAEEPKTREVPFVKSVILKNKNCPTENVRANESRKQQLDSASESLQNFENFSGTAPGSLKSSGAKSLPVTSSNEVKISFRSLRDETSIPPSFGSIKNNKSFEQILGAILSRAHNLTSSKPTSIPGSKISTKSSSSKTSDNANNIPVSQESQAQKNKEKETVKGSSNNLSGKSLNIEIRPYKCRSIREEINSLKN